MLDANDFLKAIKKAAKEAVDASQPSDFYYGKVISTNPLKIQIEQKMILSKAQLVLTRSVTKYQTSITGDFGKKPPGEKTITITVNNELHADEEVILLKQQGGQKYLVIDRMVNI